MADRTALTAIGSSGARQCQQHLVDCPVKEIFFGGTRGGGKTDGVLGKWALKEKR
jgi:hypothetical protein